ncbi:hypothetical protein ACFSKM_11835 [Ancylobacter dichloromethanicus]
MLIDLRSVLLLAIYHQGVVMSSASGTTTTIAWLWGTNTVVSFEPATDVLDFGWFSSTNFTLSEEKRFGRHLHPLQ